MKPKTKYFPLPAYAAALERITTYVDGMKDLTTEVKGYSPRIILMQVVAELQFAIAAVKALK